MRDIIQIAGILFVSWLVWRRFDRLHKRLDAAKKRLGIFETMRLIDRSEALRKEVGWLQPLDDDEAKEARNREYKARCLAELDAMDAVVVEPSPQAKRDALWLASIGAARAEADVMRIPWTPSVRT